MSGRHSSSSHQVAESTFELLNMNNLPISQHHIALDGEELHSQNSAVIRRESGLKTRNMFSFDQQHIFSNSNE